MINKDTRDSDDFDRAEDGSECGRLWRMSVVANAKTMIRLPQICDTITKKKEVPITHFNWEAKFRVFLAFLETF